MYFHSAGRAGCGLYLLWVELKEFLTAMITAYTQEELGFSPPYIRAQPSISKDPQHFTNQSPTLKTERV